MQSENIQSENAYLVLIRNGEQKELYSLDPGGVTMIGRAMENTISLPDERCSRYHARVYFENRRWYIQDLGSRNGTFVDGKLITPETRELHPGCRLQVGHSILQFGCEECEEAETPFARPVDGDSDDQESNDPGDSLTERHSGIFGVFGEQLHRPERERSLSTKIVHRRGHTAIFKPDNDDKAGAGIMTRSGFGPVDLCRIAYQLGKAEEVDQVAKLAIEGLLNATGAEGAGLWLFPYSLNSTQQASDIRLVANATLENHQYNLISESLVRTVFEKKEAILFHETSESGKRGKREKGSESGVKTASAADNTLVAPIRYQSGILGLLHLYTVKDSKYLDEADLDYTLAVADTVGVALAHVNRQKELTANLNQAWKENTSLREMLEMNSEIVSASEQMKLVHHLISRAAEGKASLLIRGESGVGKELIARAVHFAGPRKSKPLVCLNCAAVSESLLASELFGHEKGAFTGATERKIGKFEAANTGTLFLDEIGEMNPALQAKLLRVLEGSSFERVGGNTAVNIDVRVIAATNRNLEKEVAEGRFRYDLFFRLRVLEIVVPPLRKRSEDIAVLANYFLERFGKETGRRYEGFDPGAMKILMSYRWPGNVRELKNVVERAVVLGSGMYIGEQDLLLSSLNTAGETGILPEEPKEVFIPLSLEDMEKNHIIRTLEHLNWNKSLASRQLGIERTTLDRKIKRYGLERDLETSK